MVVNVHGSLDAMEEEGSAEAGSRAGGRQPRFDKTSRKLVRPGFEEEGSLVGYMTTAEKVKLSSLGGKITATHRKMREAGERPRMVGHAIRDDLQDGIDQFVSQV